MKLKHYLIASPQNNYRPWILSKTALVCFCLSVWWLRLFMPGYVEVGNTAEGLDPADLMTRINLERTNRFLPALVYNPKLTTAAGIKSQDMIDRDYFAHVDPDGNYVWPVIEAQGFKPYKALGENLAIDFTNPQALVNAWMNSPGHRANIINDKFTDQGMAAVLGEYQGRESYLVTNLFGALFEPETVAVANTATPTVNNIPQSAQQPEPSPTPRPAVQADSDKETSNNQAIPAAVSEDSTDPTPFAGEPIAEELADDIPIIAMTDSDNLKTLKITVGILAALYTIFLIIDSVIIHRAHINRHHTASSPHALAMFMIAMANFLTLWM